MGLFWKLNLDLSYKTDLDFLELFWKEKKTPSYSRRNTVNMLHLHNGICFFAAICVIHSKMFMLSFQVTFLIKKSIFLRYTGSPQCFIPILQGETTFFSYFPRRHS